MPAMSQPFELSASELLDLLGKGEVSSVEIVRSLHRRIAEVDALLGCFVHRDPKRVLHDAEVADAARARGDLKGPLHGLPLTIKDNLEVAGTDSTLGMQARRNQPLGEDAPLVQALKEAGAILLGKTNVPQLLLAQETENAIWGQTHNPWNLDRVPGGSSGGEAAAIAAGLSVAGVGTDIGGSIRIPAAFCGIAGLKPTVDRWPNRGSHTAIAGQEVVRAQAGPLARTSRDVATLFRALDPVRLAELDPGVPPLPVGDPADVRLDGLRIGYFDDDGFLTPAPALRRAVAEARAALEDAGAELVPYGPAGAQDLIYVWLGAISADGGRTIDKHLRGERISPQLKPSRVLLSLPGPVRTALSHVAGALGERKLGRLLKTLGEKGVDELWALTAERTRLRLAEFDAWRAHRLDAVICPPHVVPALPHRSSGDFTLSLSYAFRWSLLNFPAGVVPVTTVRAAEAAMPPMGERKELVEKKIDRVSVGSKGLPVGVQVVAKPFREDVVMAVMMAIEARARAREGFPRTPVTPA